MLVLFTVPALFRSPEESSSRLIAPLEPEAKQSVLMVDSRGVDWRNSPRSPRTVGFQIRVLVFRVANSGQTAQTPDGTRREGNGGASSGASSGDNAADPINPLWEEADNART